MAARTFAPRVSAADAKVTSADGLWLRPLKRNAAHRTKLDAPNLDRQLYGVYATYKGFCRDNLERLTENILKYLAHKEKWQEIVLRPVSLASKVAPLLAED